MSGSQQHIKAMTSTGEAMLTTMQVLPCLETQLEYVIKAAKKMQSDRILSMDVKNDIALSLQRYVDNWHEGGVWSGECKSWYKNNTKGGKIMCWGGSVSTHALRHWHYQSTKSN